MRASFLASFAVEHRQVGRMMLTLDEAAAIGQRFESIKRRVNVLKSTIRYRDIEDLLDKLDMEVVPRAEAKLVEVRPPARV